MIVGSLLATAVAAGLALAVGGDQLAALGLPDPGLLTRAGLPVVRALSECAAVVAVGSLLLAAFLVPPQESGYLGPDGYAAVRTARFAALVWALTAAMMVPLIAADGVGRPVLDVLHPRLLVNLVAELSQTGAWALTAGIALVLAALCWIVLSWGSAVWLFVLALVGLMPVALTGHSSAGGAHDVATSSLLYHLLAAALWVGGLIALLAHLARRGPHCGLAARRFSRLALMCWIVMAVSGVVNALVRMSPGQIFTTYGLLVLGKTAALVVLGGFGWAHRRSAVAAVALRGDRAAMLRLGGVEVLVMLATIGLAVALSQTAPPQGVTAPPSRTEVLLGYNLAGAPTLQRLLLDWRLDLVFGVGAVVTAVVYLAGVRRLRLRGEDWPAGRTVAWLGGCLVILVATSSGIGRYSMAMFSVHMGVHMLLSMLAPILLVLGAPLMLALRALPPAGAGDPPGPREWVQAFTRSWIVRMSTQPLMAIGMYVGSFYVMYFTGLYAAAAPLHWAHLVMNAHFVLMGYAYFWIIIGVDPTPHRLSYPAKLGLLMAAVPFHVLFGVSLTATTTPLGGEFYRALALPFVPDLLADQRIGGVMAWSVGELPLLVVLVVLLVQWTGAGEAARRFDRGDDAVDGAAPGEDTVLLARAAPGDWAPEPGSLRD